MSNTTHRERQHYCAKPIIRYITASCLLPLLFAIGLVFTPGMAQQVTNTDEDKKPLEWLDFKKARYFGKPILLHLRSGIERAVIFPEPIQFTDFSQSLPGCAIAIDNEVVAFFPTQTFRRTPIRFTGLNTDTVYELRVRASPQGIEQVLQILR